MKILPYVTQFVGFQTMVILDLWCCGCLWSDFWLFIKNLPQHTVLDKADNVDDKTLLESAEKASSNWNIICNRKKMPWICTGSRSHLQLQKLNGWLRGKLQIHMNYDLNNQRWQIDKRLQCHAEALQILKEEVACNVIMFQTVHSYAFDHNYSPLFPWVHWSTAKSVQCILYGEWRTWALIIYPSQRCICWQFLAKVSMKEFWNILTFTASINPKIFYKNGCRMK